MKIDPRLPLVPIVLAVTGHRELRDADLPVLAATITSELRRLSDRHPHSPCLLLSGLAEGADRLAARCALEAGWGLGVVLPLPREEYERDFSGPGSVEEFRDLMSQALWCQDISPPHAERPGCYDALGEWLARHSHALLALWDGEPGRGPGGTSDVVRRFLEGEVRGHEHLVVPDTCPVIHVHASRATSSVPGNPSQVGTVAYLSARPGGLQAGIDVQRWHDALERIEQFNRDVHQADKEGGLASLADSPALPIPPGAEKWAAGDLRITSRSLFLVADRMAVQAQRERSRMFKRLLLLAGAALVLAQTYSGLFTLPAILWSAIVMTCGGIAWYRVSKGSDVEQRYLDYRALAEACKVQYFWQVAKVGDSVCTHYLRRQSSEVEWLRLALRSMAITDLPAHAGLPDASLLKWVRDHWFEDQRRYFLGAGTGRDGKAAQNRRLDEVWSRRSQLLALGGAGLMILTATFHLFIADLTLPAHDWLLRGLMLAYSLIFGAAGLCKVYQQTSAFSEHAKKYELTGRTLQIALGQMDAALAAGDFARAVGVFRTFGMEALDENGDWLLLHRERPVSAQGFG